MILVRPSVFRICDNSIFAGTSCYVDSRTDDPGKSSGFLVFRHVKGANDTEVRESTTPVHTVGLEFYFSGAAINRSFLCSHHMCSLPARRW